MTEMGLCLQEAAGLCVCVCLLGVGFASFAENRGFPDLGQGPRQSQKASQAAHS